MKSLASLFWIILSSTLRYNSFTRSYSFE